MSDLEECVLYTLCFNNQDELSSDIILDKNSNIDVSAFHYAALTFCLQQQKEKVVFDFIQSGKVPFIVFFNKITELAPLANEKQFKYLAHVESVLSHRFLDIALRGELDLRTIIDISYVKQVMESIKCLRTDGRYPNIELNSDIERLFSLTLLTAGVAPEVLDFWVAEMEMKAADFTYTRLWEYDRKNLSSDPDYANCKLVTFVKSQMVDCYPPIICQKNQMQEPELKRDLVETLPKTNESSNSASLFSSNLETKEFIKTVTECVEKLCESDCIEFQKQEQKFLHILLSLVPVLETPLNRIEFFALEKLFSPVLRGILHDDLYFLEMQKVLFLESYVEIRFRQSK